MARGFLKDVGASKRMRFVKSPYDADNMSTPQNSVIFDSESQFNMSVYMSGTYDTGDHTGFGVIFNDVRIVNWTALAYVPLMTIQYQTVDSSTLFSGWSSAAYGALPYQFRLIASTDGLNLHWYRDANSPTRVMIKWQTYRIPT